MVIGHKLFFLLLAIILLNLAFRLDVAEAKGKAKKSDDDEDSGESGKSETEFHLTCTVLVNGSPGDSDDVGSKKGKKGRRKRSVREKRAAQKVQLLCDIDNPKGKEVAMRSVKKKKAGKDAPAPAPEAAPEE